MSQPAATEADPGIVPTYWFSKLVDARLAGDALMADGARRMLRDLGFDVQPRPAARPRRRGAAASPSATDR